MDGLSALYCVTEAVIAVTDNPNGDGTDDSPVLSRYLAAHGNPADTHDTMYIAGIPLSHFYANSSNAFDAGTLWEQVQDSCSAATVTVPTDLGIDTTLGQLGLYLAGHTTTNP